MNGSLNLANKLISILSPAERQVKRNNENYYHHCKLTISQQPLPIETFVLPKVVVASDLSIGRALPHNCVKLCTCPE